jgi:hypothetical protein
LRLCRRAFILPNQCLPDQSARTAKMQHSQKNIRGAQAYHRPVKLDPFCLDFIEMNADARFFANASIDAHSRLVKTIRPLTRFLKAGSFGKNTEISQV